MRHMPKNLFLFIWNFLKPYKFIVFLYISIPMAAGFMGPLNSYLLKIIINTLSQSVQNSIENILFPLIFLVLNFIMLDNVTWRSISYINYKYQPVIKNKIIYDTFQYIISLQQAFFQDNLSGKIASHINTLSDNIIKILYPILPHFLRNFSLLIISLFLVYHVNISFFYIMITWAIVFFSFSFIMSIKLVNLSDKYAESESNISGYLVDSISNVNNIRLFAKNNFELSSLNNLLLIRKKTFKKEELFIFIMNVTQGLLITIMLIFMIVNLVHFYKASLVTIGDFALILGVTMEIAYITWFTMSQVNEFHQALGKCKQSLSNLIVPLEVQDHKNAKEIFVKKGKIEFLNVKFQYNGMEALFQNKSVIIEAGQKVGLVGFSGGGKTTFINLILRIYDVTSGSILIDNQNIQFVTQESLRKSIAMIPQEPSLFHRTILENIHYGNIEATMDEVIAASKKAKAHSFIMNLPEGYHSLVGERGVKLSGGQKQRIAIARAILKNSPIIILDEATSQLDSVTESDIQNSLAELMESKTTIVIAHRLSTLLHMDRILVFNQGKIEEDGSHNELIKKNGLYKKLWDAQVGGFILD
ncbi:ABC transporter ATP-binding protein [Pigmentibacter sp. JX0631]|uniref:ABC transporter ATP-binding protein n=1 Tax=Pigmentibacter sp. JX0631 TaxID=2976982 RepID=UPI002468EBCC|nr:ABC transporter ATP-binding protein [Pigmentibacter sp. JX0631]WGL59748.1 ABC transporter ATP-binding protein [Pigmentibacter sp. JX0631]